MSRGNDDDNVMWVTYPLSAYEASLAGLHLAPILAGNLSDLLAGCLSLPCPLRGCACGALAVRLALGERRALRRTVLGPQPDPVHDRHVHLHLREGQGVVREGVGCPESVRHRQPRHHRHLVRVDERHGPRVPRASGPLRGERGCTGRWVGVDASAERTNAPHVCCRPSSGAVGAVAATACLDESDEGHPEGEVRPRVRELVRPPLHQHRLLVQLVVRPVLLQQGGASQSTSELIKLSPSVTVWCQQTCLLEPMVALEPPCLRHPCCRPSPSP